VWRYGVLEEEEAEDRHKVFDIELEGGDRKQAEALLKQAADKLLANTVIENYRVEVTG
jgi:phosphoribosylformylglycinamidine synthase